MRGLRAVALFACLCLLGCGQRGDPIPCEDDFRRIHSIPSRNDQRDCSNKAGMYMEALHAEGIEGVIIVVRDRNDVLHAVVQVDDTYYDPSFGTRNKNLSYFGRYRFSVTYNEIGQWGNEFKKG